MVLRIGENLNVIAKKIGEALKERDPGPIREMAEAEAKAGVDLIDINLGPARKAGAELMEWVVKTVQEVVPHIPLCLDTTNVEAMEAGLKAHKGRPLINSVSARPERMEALVPLAKKYNARLIGLTISSKGIPQNKDQRLELAAVIVANCVEQGFPVENLYLDPIVMPVNVAQAQQRDILESMREFKIISEPSPKTVVGLSNVSQGTCVRSLVNRTFMVMAIAFGLDAAILDPTDSQLMDAAITAELVLNKQIYCDKYLDAYRKK